MHSGVSQRSICVTTPLLVLFLMLLLLMMMMPVGVKGDLEPTFGRCCAYGANWARDSQACSSFPTIMTAIPTQHQSLCVTSAAICCLRYFRDEQCQKGKQVAQAGQDCVDSSSEGGEYFKDCCQGCKLGLLSGTLGMGCNSRFRFGFPWDYAFLQCCSSQASTGDSILNGTAGSQVLDKDNLYPGLGSLGPSGVIPESENLCAKLPGKLCSDVCVPTPGSYRCMCRPGFTLSSDGKTCVQDTLTDRCQANNPCDHICRDTGVSVVCSCNRGFTLMADQKSCEDIDECVEKSDTCDPVSQTCVNSQGSFRCLDRQPTCDFGYRYNEDLDTCVDINECEEGRDFCNREKEDCVNNEGNYWCSPILDVRVPATTTTTTTTTATTASIFTPPPLPPLPPRPDHIIPECPLGTEYNNLIKECIDIDECVSDPCDHLETCENTDGSFQCECLAGYIREDPDGQCEDMNECQLNLHTCTNTQRCDNTVGSYACIRIAGCGTGYTLNHNTGLCDDVDECAEGESPCHQNEQCINTLGSYRCHPLLLCNVGYEMNEAGTQCIDIDECAKGTHKCEGNQECSNRQGGYICQCPQGYRLNIQRLCVDINECETYHGRVCGNNAVCENTEGSYQCKCKEGFKQASNGITCVDVNECTEVPGICQHNCINVWGSYQCTCQAGHILHSDNKTCVDVDECESFRGRGHLCIGLCVNIPGSFKCTCPEGYSLFTDRRTCKDINECESGSLCRGIDEQCVNTRGGYKCNTITCPENYVRDSTHKNRCKKLPSYCPRDDLECLRQPLSYSYNYLPLVSNMSLSSLSQVDLFTMRGPLWSSTTVQFELELEDVKAPVGIQPVTKDYFQLRHTAFNQAVISLVKSIIGPQEIQLSLNMELYQVGRFTGSAVAKLLIYVSEYAF